MSIAVDEELGEVPADVRLAVRVGLRFFQELVQGMGIVPVDLDFREEGKGDIVFGTAEGLDLACRARFLAVELVAGKAQNH